LRLALTVAGAIPRVETLIFLHKSEDGEYLKSTADGTNGNRLEAYPTLRRRIAAVMVLPRDLERSLDAPKSDVA
jgi:hypothetical protein